MTINIIKLFILLAFLSLHTKCFLQHKIVRVPKWAPLVPPPHQSVCPDQKKINQQAQYKEICYEKDISYSAVFYKDNLPYYMSVDLTAPISWIKHPDCHIQDQQDKACQRIESMPQDAIHKVKKKLKKALHLHKSDEEVENAMIEGSSEIIRGEFQKSKDICFDISDSSRFTNIFDLLLMGIYVLGERDTVFLESTNFINAISLTQNLNNICDGAISLRFDQSSQNSFLNEIFAYKNSGEKVVTIYLGQNHSLTMGEATYKYSETGYSGVQWIQLPDDQGYGKWAQISSITVEDVSENIESDTSETLPAVLTLSASYIGLPLAIIESTVIKYVQKLASCKMNTKINYLECSFENKKNMKKMLEMNLIFTFSESSMMIKFVNLTLPTDKRESKRVTFNIKASENQHAILGEPLFYQYFILLDYSKNRIGYAPARTHFEASFFNAVTLIHFMVVILLLGIIFPLCFLGCCTILCFHPFNKYFSTVSQNIFGNSSSNPLRLIKSKNYTAVKEDAYDEVNKMEDTIKSGEQKR